MYHKGDNDLRKPGKRKMYWSDSLMVLSETGIKKITRKPKLLPKYLEKTKIDEMLEKARNDNKRNYLILLALWRTGIRNGELINLKKRDIKVDELTIRQGKGHKDRIVPLDTHLSDLLQYHTAKISLDERVFPLTSAQIPTKR